MDWKTPSHMVDRQMLPRQTNRTEIWSGILIYWRKTEMKKREQQGEFAGYGLGSSHYD
jgi:hypothetical protein